MKKFLAFASLLAILSFVATPAMADTKIYLSSHHAPVRYKELHNRGRYHYSHPRYSPRAHYAPHYRARTPHIWPIFYPVPERRVVIERPVVYFVPQEVPMQAIPTSQNYFNASGQECRDYQTSSSSGNIYGTACKFTDGTWRVVN